MSEKKANSHLFFPNSTNGNQSSSSEIDFETFLKNSFLYKIHQNRFSIYLIILKGLQTRNRYTFNHSIKVYLYTEVLIKKLNLSDEEKEILLTASLLHDIGKLTIPDNILLKNGKLTEEERQVIQQHPIHGAQFIKGIHTQGHNIAKNVLYHHERWDGSGYPLGLAKNEIPFSSQIIAICDVFDAMTEWRPYRPAMRCDEALDYIVSQREKHFHPEVVDLFLDAYDEIIIIKKIIIPKEYYMKRYEEKIETVSQQFLQSIVEEEEDKKDST